MSNGILDIYFVIDFPQDENFIAVFRSSLQETLAAMNQQNPDWSTRFHLLTCGKTPRLYLLEYGKPIPALTGEKKFYIGNALQKLTKALEKNDAESTYCPIIIFGSPRFPDDDFVDDLYCMRHSKYYDEAVKIGFAFGEAHAYSLMKLLCKYDEAIVDTNDLSLFSRLIKVKEKIREEQIPVAVDPPNHGENVVLTGDIIYPSVDGDILGDDTGW